MTESHEQSPRFAAAQRFVSELDQAINQVYPGSGLANKLNDITLRLLEDCKRLAGRGESVTPTIAIIGEVGEGKSWLARCFLSDVADNDPVRAELKTGQNSDARSNHLTWFGPQKFNSGLDVGERFFLVPADRMLDLGRSYLVGDSPGFSDAQRASAVLSHNALTSAAVKIVVFSTAVMRAGNVDDYVREMNGALILPVVRFRPATNDRTRDIPTPEVDAEVQNRLKQWRQLTAAATILDPCYVPDEDVYDPGKDLVAGGSARDVVRRRLQQSLTPYLRDAQVLRQSVESQIAAQLATARRDVEQCLLTFRRRIEAPLARLNEQSQTFGHRLCDELLGDELTLRAGIRQRFRAEWLDRIPLICFPFRPFSLLLQLTVGAWDKLIFSLMGSVPSLALVVFRSVKNLAEAERQDEVLQQRLRCRVESLLENELKPQLRIVQTALLAVLPEVEANRAVEKEGLSGTVQVTGLESVADDSCGIVRESVECLRASGITTGVLAVLGSISFWVLLAGPIIAIYRTYLHAWWNTLSGQGTSFGEFPLPSINLILVSLVLSAAPALVLAMIGIAWCCNAIRLRNTVDRIRQRHEAMIQRRRDDKTLHVEITDSRVNAGTRLLQLLDGAMMNVS